MLNANDDISVEAKYSRVTFWWLSVDAAMKMDICAAGTVEAVSTAVIMEGKTPAHTLVLIQG